MSATRCGRTCGGACISPSRSGERGPLDGAETSSCLPLGAKPLARRAAPDPGRNGERGGAPACHQPSGPGLHPWRLNGLIVRGVRDVRGPACAPNNTPESLFSRVIKGCLRDIGTPPICSAATADMVPSPSTCIACRITVASPARLRSSWPRTSSWPDAAARPPRGSCLVPGRPANPRPTLTLARPRAGPAPLGHSSASVPGRAAHPASGIQRCSGTAASG